MRTALIDTLRYADRLKEAGIETHQAEAMSRALKDELGEGFATKNDVDGAVDELKGEIARLDAKFEAMDAKFDARFETMDAKFDALKDTFGTQSRYVFLVLALIAALGFYNAAAPKFAGAQFPAEEAQPPAPAHAAPAGQTPAGNTG